MNLVVERVETLQMTHINLGLSTKLHCKFGYLRMNVPSQGHRPEARRGQAWGLGRKAPPPPPRGGGSKGAATESSWGMDI